MGEDCIKNSCPVFLRLLETNKKLEFEQALLDQTRHELAELRAASWQPKPSQDLQHLTEKDRQTIEQFRTKK